MTTVHPDRHRAVLTLAAILLGAAARADVEASFTVTSRYLHRGLEYSQSSPAWQAAVEYEHAGWFAGLWAGTVGFGAYDGVSSEIDYYAGYGKRLSRHLALEGTVIRYTFQGDSRRDRDWSELQLSAYLGDRWTLTWGIADNWWATDERTRFVEATLRHPLPWRLIFDATAGYQLAERAAGVDYGYLEAGVSRRLDDLVLRVGYAAVGRDAGQRFLTFADDHWLASLTWQP